MKPRTVDASANQNTRSNTQTSLNASGRRKGRKTRTNLANLKDIVPPLLMRNGDDSSSSSDDFITEDKRSGFPIDSSRSSSIKWDYPVKTVVDTVTDDYLYNSNNQSSVNQIIRLSEFLTSTSNYNTIPTGSIVRDQFSNSYDRWTTQIQEIRLNTSMYSFWNIENVYEYIWNVVQGLSIYCCLDSILAIDEPAGEVNRVNSAMKKYYNDPDLLNAQDALRRKLKNQWLPPHMSKLILWTYQLYKTNNNATCIQYRFVPDDAFVKLGGTDDAVSRLITVINNIITDLEQLDMTRVRSILRSTLPSGCINTIPHACNKPTYDATHHEIYANQASLWFDASGNDLYFPILPEDSTGYTIYGMKSDPTGDNGFAFALSQSFRVNDYKDNDIFNTFTHSLVTTNWRYGTNTWFADPASFNIGGVNWSRNNLVGQSAFDESGVIHLIEIDSTTGLADRSCTVMPLGYQRVYFNSFNQRLLISKQVFRELFTVK